jgi:hypothetical protein
MVSLPTDKPDSVALLPYVEMIFNSISRVLSQHDMKSVGLPSRNISGFFRPAKGDIELKIQGSCSVPCECGGLQRGRSMGTRLKEYHRYIRLEHPDKSSVAELFGAPHPAP